MTHSEAVLFGALMKSGRGYYGFLVFLVAVIAWGVYAYSLQLRYGLVVTGMREPVLWGLYISNFVFFIGISHAGTLISAILRVTNAEWRRPITRMAEAITVMAISVGALFPIIDLGRPDRIPNIFIFGRIQSPILWDFASIFTYLTGSLIYLYLPLIPDIAEVRDKLPGASRWKKFLYSKLSLGWIGSKSQKTALQKGIGAMAIIIIPVAVSVHTVVSWIFAMTLRVPWDSALFGAFFVAGAIFSGIAILIVVMAILRRAYHLGEYVTEKHFVYLGYLMAAFAAIMIYANISELLTHGYKLEEGVEFHFRQLFLAEFAPLFWFYLLGGLVAPIVIALLPATRNVRGMVVAAILVTFAMWIERFVIVVTGLRVPLMPYEPADYLPTWIEWSLLAAGLALFALLITIFSKVFPIIAVWEVAEEHESMPVVPEAVQPAAPEILEPSGGTSR